ncbi:Scr1 family TA system antitoxin-like transcriptional regulator [Streptomyces sp. NPDC048417]|uniref:Scr1 family TA system antitoxin-like transcriptional regulator n=1 Tax=Streptomyces sp. NPDC048417 TaxID=3155387 RepID=UPI0034238484
MSSPRPNISTCDVSRGLGSNPPFGSDTDTHNFPGGAATARGQLGQLAEVAELPNVSLRIFPFGRGTHPGLNGSFNIMSFAESGAMDVVYVEAPFAQRWVEGGNGAAAYDELFEMITEHERFCLRRRAGQPPS